MQYIQYVNCKGDGGDAFGFRRRPFFWRSSVFGRKNRSNFRFRPEKAFRFRRKPFFFCWRSPVFGRTNRLNFRFRPKKSLRISAFFFCLWRSPVFGRTNRLNFRFRPEKTFGFRRKPFFLGITCFWPEKPIKFSISARKSLRIPAKTFFFSGDHLFLAGQTA